MRTFKDLSIKERCEYIGIMAIYPLILLYEQIGKSVKFINSRSKQITASILTVCLICTMIPVMAFTSAATTSVNPAAPQVSYSIGEAYKYTKGGSNITSLTYGTSSPKTSTAQCSIEDNEVYLQTTATVNKDDGSKNSKLIYVPVAVTVTVPANQSFSMTHSISGEAWRWVERTAATTVCSAGIYYLGETDTSSSLTFYPYYSVDKKDDNDNKELDMGYLGENGYYRWDFSVEAEKTVKYENATDTAKNVTHYFGVLLAIQYGSEYVNTSEATFAFSNGPAMYDLYVAGEQVSSDNASDILGDGAASFDAMTNTLTVSGDIDATGISNRAISHLGIGTLGINVTDNATLSTNSTIAIGASESSGALNINIDEGKTLTVRSNSGSAAVYATKGITVTGGTLDVMGTGNYAIRSGGKLTVSDGTTLCATGSTAAIYAGGGVDINGLAAKGSTSYNAVESACTEQVSFNTNTFKLGEENAKTVVIKSSIPDYYITLDDGVVYKNNNQVVLDGADYGITVSGNETDGYTYTFTNVDFSTSAREAFRIHDTKPATIVLVGENKITLTTAIDNMTYAINSSASLIIKGEGSLVATGADSTTRMAFGISTNQDLTVESGSVTAIAGSGKNMSGGLYVQGTLTVTGGSVVGIGDRQGIYARESSVDGCVLTGSYNKDGTAATTITDLAGTEIPWMKVEKPVHIHDNITFDKEWTAKSGELASGNYYLTESNAEALNADITVPENEEVILCLNGNTLAMGTGWFRNNGTLTICDCSAEEIGKITSSGDRCFENKGILNVISGTVENTKKNGFCINGGTNSIVNLSGGKFIADWGVTSNGTVYLSGAPIFDCSSVDLGCLTNGVIYAQSNDTIPVAYSGEALLLNLVTPVTVGKTVVKNITVANSGLFSINNKGYFLKQSGVDLVVDKTHTHDNITFDKEWTAKSGELTSGNYYLTESNAKKLTENITIPEGATVNLCLNGNTLNLGSKTIINNGTLNIYDCGEGEIKTESSSETLGAVCNNGTLTLNGVAVHNIHTFATSSVVVYNTDKLTITDSKIIADGGNGIYNAEGGVAEIKGTSTVTADYCPFKNYGKFTLTKGELTCVSGNSTGVYNADNAKFIMVDGTVNAATGLGNHGDAQISGGTLQGDITGIDNYATLNITNSTATGSAKYGIQNYSSATATVSTGTTVSGLEYGIHNSGILYLCNKPSISGDDTNHADIYYNSGSIYAKNSNGSLLYTGDALTVKVYNPENNIGSVIINKVSSINNDKFSVVNEDYFLKQINTDLILAKLHKHNGMTFTEWDDAYSLPTTAGNYCLTTDIVNRSGASFTAPSGNTNICLNGHTITTTTDNPLINVPNNANLSIYDCNTDKVRYGQWKSGNYLLSDTAPDGEYDTITGGVLSGGYFYASAGAVNVWGGGVFNLYSGTLAGNSSGSGGGAVNVGEESTFNMYGGKIAYNKSNSGGGVYVEDGTFNMYGGSITNNTASTYGDAIYIDSGTVSIEGGTVKGTNSYGIYGGRGNIYLSGTPEISGSEDIYRYGCKIYAHANGDINDSYEGNPLTIKISSSFTDGVVVYEVNDNNAEKFSLAESCTQTLVRVGNNLIVDGTAPTGEISIGENGWIKFWNTVTFGIFCKNYVEITITGADAQTDVKSIEYYISDTAIDDEGIKGITAWQIYTQKIRINAERKVFVYAKITDNAGNVTYLSVNGGIVVFKDTEITTGEYEYTLTTKKGVVTDIKPGNNTVKEIDLCEPGGNARDSIDFTINANGYIVLDGDDIESVAKDYYSGDYTVTISYNALGEEYGDEAIGDKITDTVLTLKVKRFKVEKPAADSTVFTYNGSKQTYTVAESDYYTVTGNKRTNAGEQDVTVALKDTNTFEWADGKTDNLTFKFNIGKATPNIGVVSVTAPSKIYFNTAPEDITLGRTDTAVSGSLKLTAGQTLTVGTREYDWSFNPDDTVNYKNISGKVSVTVSKIQLDVSGVYWDTIGFPTTYDGTKKNVYLVGTLPTGVVAEKSGNTAINAGNYTAQATFKLDEGYSSENYEIIGATDNKAIANWVINPKVVVATVIVSPESYTYTGNPIIPGTVIVNDGGAVIPANEYEVDYINNTNAGVATVNVTDIVGGNYQVSGTQNFVIGKADPEADFPTDLSIDTGKKLSDIALPEGYTWDNPDTAVTYGINKYAMTYVVPGPYGAINYNSASQEVEVNGLDITAPTGEINLKNNKWTDFLNGITFGIFFKETQSITITAADTESGVKEIAYYLSAEELSIDDVKALESSKWTVYTAAFNVEPDNKYVVYAKLTDNAGNVVYINSDGIVLDSIKPVIAGVEDGRDVYGDATFTVDEEYLDTVTLDGEPVEVINGEYSVPADNMEHTIVVTDKTGNAVTYKLTVYKNYKVSFVVNGEEIDIAQVGYGKDATLPEIPAKDGYTAKWDVDGKNITSDTVITAIYEKLPVTGDKTNLPLWTSLLILSGISVFGIIITKKRKEEENK